MTNALTVQKIAPLTPYEQELLKSPEAQKALLSDPNPRELRPVVDSAGHIRFEAAFSAETVNIIDFYGKKFFSRAMLRELGYTEFGEQLKLTINGLHNEHVSEEFSQYKSGRTRRFTVSFQECGTRLVMNATNRRALMAAMPRGEGIGYLSRPHTVELFAGETPDRKGAVMLKVTQVATDEVIAQRRTAFDAEIDDLFPQDD